MFDEPEEIRPERPVDPADRAREKSDEFRMHAELAAVFEGTRKTDAELRPGMDAALAREIQQSIGRLANARAPESPILPPDSVQDAVKLLTMPDRQGVSTNDYHIHRRPGEVYIVRWLAGDEVAAFYERLQAHFDAALEGEKEDQRQAHQWKQDAQADAYLKALNEIDVKMADRYLRPLIQKHSLTVLSTQAADELNIQYLADYIMSVPIEEIVGSASAPPDDPTPLDLAWFFKLFSLRGMQEGAERMCFFAFFQKTEEGW